SADYWERPESRVTLGTAAPVLAGLEAAARMHQRAGLTGRADLIDARADTLRTAITEEFGRFDYGRYARRTAQDAAVAFTMPPFLGVRWPVARGAWETSSSGMARPGGGRAPGPGWSETTMSWTPKTALNAWVAADKGQETLVGQWI